MTGSRSRSRSGWPIWTSQRADGAIVWWGHYTRAWRAMPPGLRRLLDAPSPAALEGQIIRSDPSLPH